ncbi:MAG: hypothetical protein JXB15_11495 [Anaerolineales bacterium]|nr:hypothetical protein [Anaerolineales bacterium]
MSDLHAIDFGKGLLSAHLGDASLSVQNALAEIKAQRIIERIWSHDHTVWKPEPAEIANRLGWLRVAENMQKEALPVLEALVQSVRAQGYTHALLLGMGGSSLAPEVLRQTLGVRQGYLDLAVLDSTDPGAVQAYADRLDLSRTLFIVSTKSGGTVETFSFFRFFYNRLVQALGPEQAGQHFIAITDPGSKLAEIASQLGFRLTLLNDPEIGGRYSALSYFGMAPAALIGADVAALLSRAIEMARLCTGSEESNPAAWLGAMMGEMARLGRDKLTLVASPSISSFGDWVEQLVAESTGKEGQGILPLVGEVLGQPELYGPDRLFVYLHLQDDPTYDLPILSLQAAGFPLVRLEMRDLLDLGAQFFLWELATAVAGWRLGINPFDQPDVEAAKVIARKMVAAYQQQGTLPELTPVLQAQNLRVYGDIQAATPAEALHAFLAQARPGGYVAIQAYIQPSHEADAALLDLRTALRGWTRLAVTTGYGPRFLHSTGQLHKGDAGNSLFIQITSSPDRDASIPDEAGSHHSSISFGILELAQALGDRQALLDAGRKVLRFHLEGDVVVGLARLTR